MISDARTPRSIRMLLGVILAIAGLSLLGWLADAIYTGAEILVVLGIPLLMTIGWCGLALVLAGFALALRK